MIVQNFLKIQFLHQVAMLLFRRTYGYILYLYIHNYNAKKKAILYSKKYLFLNY